MGTARFLRAHRLLTPGDYRRVFDQPLRSSDHCFTILARRIEGDTPRLGLAIAKKHIKHAVQRNRVKRQIREYFRQNKSNLAPLDLVVLAKPGLDQKSNQEIRSSLARHWKRLNKKFSSL